MDISNRVKLLRKIFRVMKAIPEIVKTGQMQEGESKSYAYHEADVIRRTFRAELLHNRLLCLPISVQPDHWGNPTSTGGTFNYCQQKIRFAFIDTDTGEQFDCESVGTGGDGLDKASPKAAIQALKYFLVNAFFVEGIELDGDSPEEQLAGREANKQHQWFEGACEAIHAEKDAAWIMIDGNRLFATTKKFISQLRKLADTTHMDLPIPRYRVRTYMGQLSGNGINPHPIIDKIEVLDAKSVPAEAAEKKAAPGY